MVCSVSVTGRHAVVKEKKSAALDFFFIYIFIFIFFYSNEQTGTYRLTNLTTQITLCDISVTTSAIYIYNTTWILHFLTFLHSPKIFLLPLCCSVIQCRQKGCMAVIAELLLWKGSEGLHCVGTDLGGRLKKENKKKKRKERRLSKLKLSKVPTFLEGWLLFFPHRDKSTWGIVKSLLSQARFLIFTRPNIVSS